MKNILVITILLMLIGTAGCTVEDRVTEKVCLGELDVTGLQAANIISGYVTAENVTAAILMLTSLPTTDPGIPGAVWSDNGTLKVSK